MKLLEHLENNKNYYNKRLQKRQMKNDQNNMIVSTVLVNGGNFNKYNMEQTKLRSNINMPH